jgi:hypothetical protein
MKNKALTLVLTGVVAMSGFSLSAQESDKTAGARKEIAEAKKDLKEAKIDSAEDFQKFKIEAELKIRKNQTKIAELKAKKPNGSEEICKKYHKKILVLEQKNNQLRNRINKSDATKTTMWGAFKRHFNHDMEELGDAFRDLDVNNTK